jgi:hypothetical protein
MNNEEQWAMDTIQEIEIKKLIICAESVGPECYERKLFKLAQNPG